MLGAEKASLPTLVARLFQDAQEVVRAEARLAKTKLFARIKAARLAAVLFVAALVIALASLTGLVLGLVLALVPFVGAALAGVIVLAGGLVLAGLLAWIGAKQLGSQTATEPTT